MFEPEERRIAERIKDFTKSKKSLSGTYIMLRDGQILYIDDYRDMVKAGKINPQDAYVYIDIDLSTYKMKFYYPFLDQYDDFLEAYLSKLGFCYNVSVVPIASATGLKYVVVAEVYGDYLSVEVANLNIVVNNLNLRKVVFEVMGEKIISGEEELTYEVYGKILDIFNSQIIYQLLFAGHNIDETRELIYDYHDNDNKSLVKEAARIAIDYERIFQPYRVCYETRTWKEVDCLSIKLD